MHAARILKKKEPSGNHVTQFETCINNVHNAVTGMDYMYVSNHFYLIIAIEV